MKDPKTILAAALEYDAESDAAPRVVARGRGAIAEKIMALAREHNIPIRSDPGLVQLLSRLEIDEQIPIELYRAVAEILAFVYKANSRYGPGK
jgi:flagellar biosynthesis protein